VFSVRRADDQQLGHGGAGRAAAAAD